MWQCQVGRTAKRCFAATKSLRSTAHRKRSIGPSASDCKLMNTSKSGKRVPRLAACTEVGHLGSNSSKY